MYKSEDSGKSLDGARNYLVHRNLVRLDSRQALADLSKRFGLIVTL